MSSSESIASSSRDRSPARSPKRVIMSQYTENPDKELLHYLQAAFPDVEIRSMLEMRQEKMSRESRVADNNYNAFGIMELIAAIKEYWGPFPLPDDQRRVLSKPHRLALYDTERSPTELVVMVQPARPAT